MAKDAKEAGHIVDPEILSGWAQRALRFFGNANCALSTDPRRSLLIEIEPRLGLYVGRGKLRFLRRTIY